DRRSYPLQRLRVALVCGARGPESLACARQATAIDLDAQSRVVSPRVAARARAVEAAVARAIRIRVTPRMSVRRGTRRLELSHCASLRRVIVALSLCGRPLPEHSLLARLHPNERLPYRREGRPPASTACVRPSKVAAASRAGSRQVVTNCDVALAVM